MDFDNQINNINKYYGLVCRTPEIKGTTTVALKYNNGSKKGSYPETVNYNSSYSYRMTHPFRYFRRINKELKDSLTSEAIKILLPKMRIIWFPDNQFVTLAVESTDVEFFYENFEIARDVAETLGLTCYAIYDKVKKYQDENFDGTRIRSICSFLSTRTIKENQIYPVMKSFGYPQFRTQNSAVYFCITTSWPKPTVLESSIFNFHVKGLWEMNDMRIGKGLQREEPGEKELSVVSDQLKLTFTSILNFRKKAFPWCMLTWDVINDSSLPGGFYTTIMNQRMEDTYQRLDSKTDLAKQIQKLTEVINKETYEVNSTTEEDEVEEPLI